MISLNDELILCMHRGEFHVGILDMGTITIYSGAPPSISSPPTGTMLAQYNNIHWGSDGRNSMRVIDRLDTRVISSGIAGYFRITSPDGRHIIQGDIGRSGADLNMSSTELRFDSSVTISTMVLHAGFDMGVSHIPKAPSKEETPQYTFENSFYWEGDDDVKS